MPFEKERAICCSVNLRRYQILTENKTDSSVKKKKKEVDFLTQYSTFLLKSKWSYWKTKTNFAK